MDSSPPSEVGTIYLEDLAVGMRRTISKSFGGAEIEMFSELSEDRNPLHLCEETAAKSIFGGRVAHGMLSASLFSALLGERIPGHGTIYLEQNLRFVAPVKIGDTVEAEVEVAEIIPEKKRVRFSCIARVGDRAVIKGDALVMAPSRSQG